MDGVKGTFRGVMSDIDRMTKDGVTDLGTMSFQQFKPVGTTVSSCGVAALHKLFKLHLGDCKYVHMCLLYMS